MVDVGLTVEMLPSRHGDGLWIEWGAPGDRHRMLVDGGPRGSYEALRQRIEALPADDRVIDLLVVTHIDLDHIEAPIEMLRSPPRGLTIREVWFNDHRHLARPDGDASDGDGSDGDRRGGPDVTRGGVQGEFLSALLERRGLPWNTAFGGGAVTIAKGSPLPRVELAGGLTLVLLSPTTAMLEALIPAWEKAVTMADLTPGDRAQAELLLEKRMGPIEPTRDRTSFGGDGSEANGSSIAFIAEYAEERWLFAGDAHEDVLREGLRRYAGAGGLPVRLDGFKLPHHGSVKNVSPQLLAMISCPRYLVSTNGAYFQHPDAACIDLVAARPDTQELVFNYWTEFTEPWSSRQHPATTYLYDRDGRPATPTGPAAAPDRSLGGQATATEPAAPTVATTPLAVRLFHGSFDRADSPVMVGHYEATPLSGAEGYVDGQYGGRLSDRHMRDQYPGGIGSCPLLVKAPPLAHPASGVLVVALGPYGELTPRALAETIRTSLVSYGLTVADAAPARDTPLRLEMSSVLIGATGDRGMSVQTSARAIIQGTVEANQTLMGADGRARCQFEQLDFWERRAPDAELALMALESRTNRDDADDEATGVDPFPPEVTFDGELRRADGGLDHSVPADRDDRPWRRITVKSVRSGRDADADADGDADEAYLDLEYGVDGRLAGLGIRPHRVERRRLDHKLDRFAGQSEPGESLYRTLYELLLPNEVKWELTGAADIQLVVDPAVADIPWELLAARNPRRKTREPLALRAHLTRQLLLRPPDQLPDHVERADELRALVIGNPPAGAAWPQLQGAYDEALAVTATLERSIPADLVDSFVFEPGGPTSAEELDDATASIENALFEHDYRIVHIAGHGEFDAAHPDRTGVVIGPDTHLTARFLGQVRPVPDLVFLNCCHLGVVGEGQRGANPATDDFSRLGASLATELIRAGVRAVVAAGWAVEDRAATAFATTFYHQMVHLGATFAEAVFEARVAAVRASPSSNTWGAYQCYGDSGLRLAFGGGISVPRVPTTTRELLRRLELLIDDVEGTGASRRGSSRSERIDQELTVLAEAARTFADAPDAGVIAEQLGRAHAELQNFELAAEWYDRAVADPAGSASIRAIEQRANVRDRFAARLMRGAERTRADERRAAALATRASADIELLQGLGVSPERSALLGGHFKRQATVQAGVERSKTLERAADEYRHAYDDDVTARGDEADAYPFINYVQLEEIRQRLRPRTRSRVTDDDRRLLARLARARRRQSEQSYWDAVSRADAKLALALCDDSVPSAVASIAKLYITAFERRSTGRQRSSALEHLEDLIALHPDDEQCAGLRAIVDRIDEHLAR